MKDAMSDAGKTIDYVEYDDLAHDLDSTDARIDMLTKIGNFLNANMK